MISEIVEKLGNLLGSEDIFIPLHEPEFNTDSTERVRHCVDSGWVSTAGPAVGEFEEELSSFLGGQYCFATNSGTSALHLALIGAGVKSEDEVLCPSATFVATANAISYCGAKPNFIDCEYELEP